MSVPVSPKPSPLGRGLSALFGDTDASYQPRPSAMQASATQVSVKQPSVPITSHAPVTGGPMQVAVAWLQPGAFQPRRHFDEDALQGLANSIRERGILEPLVVRPIATMKDRYEIIAGERRWRAAQSAGVHNVPVIVRNLTDLEALEFGLIENVQRQDLSPLEEAEGYQRLLEEFGHSQENLAKIVGKSRPHISNLLRVLTLPVGVRQLIDEGKLTIGHARAVVMAPDPLATAQEVVRKGLNVRQTEALIKRRSANPEIHKHKKTREAEADVLALEKELERVIGMKVKIETKGKSGSLSLFYHDLDQLDEIIRKLRS